MFHSRTAALVSLSNNNRTAQRDHPTQEFNHGVVLSSEQLKDDQIFQVRIDKKVSAWSGSIEIGVTTCDPNILVFPTSASSFREGTWVMSGSSILKDGHSIIEEYGRDLDQLTEGDRVGVMRTSQGVLHFYVNDVDQGCAASGIPSKVFGVIDMYGKCAQVSVVSEQENAENNLELVGASSIVPLSNAVASISLNHTDNIEVVTELLNTLSNHLSNQLSNELIAGVEQQFMQSNDRLMFHEKCGTLVKLSNTRRTAERRRPLDEFNNGVVMTNRPIKDDEMFEIRLDRLVDKWSGSIEVGITTHNPSLLDFPATMTNMRSGTVMMSGFGILTNGKGTRREYSDFNLDELAEGDRIGLLRKEGGTLHYYINGMDQGVASTEAPTPVWGVIDLYGMTVKVTIIDRMDPDYPSTPVNGRALEECTSRLLHPFSDIFTEEQTTEDEPSRLMFHPQCGSHAAVINGQRTAHRPNAMDDFNNGVVLTQRALRPDELFEVRIDKMVDKWAGSIEIGVTAHVPIELDYPSTMTNIRSGTWMMTGNGVMHNGTTVIDDYGQNLDGLKVTDKVGVRRQPDGTLHFYVNSIDQGPAASNVPDGVYGVIDLYGQAAQATICDISDTLSSPELDSSFGTEMELRFHTLHGQNSMIINNGRTAARPNPSGEFNDAVVISNRPLRDNELFEIVIEKIIDRWSGSLEAGVTLIKPESLPFPNTMTDIDRDTWMLSGTAIMQDGLTIHNGYPLDLDSLTIASRLGIMRCSDASLHFFLNGTDMGIACRNIPPGVFAVIDLYGQCAQVAISSGSGILSSTSVVNTTTDMERSVTSPYCTETSHRFSPCCSKNVVIQNNGTTACRMQNANQGVVFSAEPLKPEELFEVKVDQLYPQWSGTVHIGLTCLAISDTMSPALIPNSAREMMAKVTWIFVGTIVMKNGVLIKDNYGPSLERLEVGNRIGVKRSSDATMHIFVNGEDLGVAASNIPKNVFAVVDLYGSVESVSITSNVYAEVIIVLEPLAHTESKPLVHDNALEIDLDHDQDTAEDMSFEFHCNHGKNMLLRNGQLSACRTASYNQGMVVTRQSLPRSHLFQVRIDQLNPRWSSSLSIGVLGMCPGKMNVLPVSAMGIKKSCVVMQGDHVYTSGTLVNDKYGPNLDKLQVGDTVGLLVDEEGALHLYVNGKDQGVATHDVPNPCYTFVDLYGQCEQVTIVSGDVACCSHASTAEYSEKADLEQGMKEKQTHSSIESPLIQSCEYLHLCQRFISTLALPVSYFDCQKVTCYCENCHKLRADDLYCKQGEPPKEYALPIGWCRFSFRVPSKGHVLNVFEKWHVCYHATNAQVIRRTLDCGNLLSVVDVECSGNTLLPEPMSFTEKSRPDGSESKQIFLSPTLKYTGQPHFAPRYRFTDPKTKRSYDATLAFQVWVKPGSYKIGPQSIGANEVIDARFSNNELEWCTKERGSTVLCSLIVRTE